MKKLVIISTLSVLTVTSLMAGPLVNAVILDNNGNPTKSVANKAVKVKAGKHVADSNSSVAGKVVKGKMIRGDYRMKRKVQNR